MRAAHRARCGAALGLGGLLLTGCSSAQQPEVEKAAATFDDPSGDASARCDLLAPATLAAFEKDQKASCADAVGQLSLHGGAVTSVQVWGGGAQVRMAGDTVFLTETTKGWRVTAAGCTSQGDAPYDCEVEGP